MLQSVEKVYDTLKKFNAMLLQGVKGLSELVKIFEAKLDVCIIIHNIIIC